MQLVVHDSAMSFNAVSIIDLPMRIITILCIGFYQWCYGN